MLGLCSFIPRKIIEGWLTIVTNDMHFVSQPINDQLLRGFGTKNFKMGSSIDAKETKMALNSIKGIYV